MSHQQQLIAEAVKEHAGRILKSVAYPQVWTHVSEEVMNKAIEEVLSELVGAVLKDPTVEEVLSQTQLFTHTGKLNGSGIHGAILHAAESSSEPLRAKLTHLAKNAEIVFRSARLFRETPHP